jgi:molecular chaperone GrpE
MAKGNGKIEINSAPGGEVDVDHELPAPEADPVAPSEADKLRDERDQLFDRLARLQAEFDNYRKRSAKEQQDFKEYAVADAVKALLPALDSLERAVDAAHSDKATSTAMRDGVELTLKQLQDALARVGVTAIAAQGAEFDPQLHEAVEVVATSQVAENHVVDELQRGYRIKDRLLRPAMVRVAGKK